MTMLDRTCHNTDARRHLLIRVPVQMAAWLRLLQAETSV